MISRHAPCVSRDCVMLRTTVLIVVMLFAAGCRREDNSAFEISALRSAESWLKIVDAGEYEKSYESSSELARKMVTKKDWSNGIRTARGFLGNVVSREAHSSRYLTSLPGAPDGKYVVIRFRTVFENKKRAIEIVTPMLDNDGQWRVSGYYIR
jgi:hypothetical protein